MCVCVCGGGGGGGLTRPNTNLAVQPQQKIARGLKFWIKKAEAMY